MPSKPELHAWDSCCLIGILNGERDKVAALLAEVRRFETGEAVLGIPSGVVSEVVTLADGSPALGALLLAYRAAGIRGIVLPAQELL